MSLWLSLIASLAALILSVRQGIFIGYALIGSWFCLAMHFKKQGFTYRQICKLSVAGGKRAALVIRTLLLIGAVMGAWLISGTIPAVVYYSLEIVTPSTFVLLAFLVASLAALLLGTALGAVSLVGVPLIIIGRAGGVPVDVAAGAIMSGIYFGDRCSPLSGSAALIGSMTRTDVLHNIKNMLPSTGLPFAISLVFYGILSQAHPLRNFEADAASKLFESFQINPLLLAPALLLMALILWRVKLYFAIVLSVLLAALLAVVFQNQALSDVLSAVITGVEASGGLAENRMFTGGGMLSMVKSSTVVLVSCAISGLLEGAAAFKGVSGWLRERQFDRASLFASTAATSLLVAMVGCSQTISSVMTADIMKKSYSDADKSAFALDLENSAVLLSALVPWNIAALVPTTLMHVDMAGFLPYAVFIYALPLTYYGCLKFCKARARRDPLDARR